MVCEIIQPLLSGYVDNELNGAGNSSVEKHVSQCHNCRQDLANFSRLKEVTESVQLLGLTVEELESYWCSIYNRIGHRLR